MRVCRGGCPRSVLSAVVQVTVHPRVEFVVDVGSMRSCGGCGGACFV